MFFGKGEEEAAQSPFFLSITFNHHQLDHSDFHMPGPDVLRLRHRERLPRLQHGAAASAVVEHRPKTVETRGGDIKRYQKYVLVWSHIPNLRYGDWRL